MTLLNKLSSIFSLGELHITPVPADHYQPSASFEKGVRSALSQGNVSMGVGRMFTKKLHDEMYNSIKDYHFI